MRLFVAADPPPDVREETAAWGRHVAKITAGLRPVPAENCHITLAFLGEHPESGLAGIRDALRTAAAPNPDFAVPLVSLGAPVWLPPRRPRALALEIHDDRGDLAGLQGEVAAALERAVGWRSKRRFRAHLTVARGGRGLAAGGLRLPRSPDLEFEIGSVTLYASTLLPDGARYEPLERAILA